jgi:catecholate siderophore receptor
MAHDVPRASARPLRDAPTLLPLGALMLAGLSFGAQAQTAATPVTTGTQELPTITVRATGEPVPDGYRATGTRVGKTLQDPHDVPQAITTVTNTLMEEQQVGSLREALRNVSGLTFNAAEGGRSGDNMSLRGFYTFGDMYLDGIRDTAQYNRETFNLEQIDVLRGSAAMLFGRGQAGGVINQVSKTPLLGDRGKITGSLGTDDYREVTGDFNKQLGDNTAVRLNVMKRDEGSWRSNPATGTEPEVHREGVGVSLVTGLYTDDEITFSHYYLKTADNADYGISFDPATKRPTRRFSSSDFWGIDPMFDDSETNITSLVHQHRFSPKAELRTQLRYANYERVYWAAAPSNTVAPSANGVTGGSNKTRTSHTETLTLQSDFSARAELLGMKHELLAGVEYLQEDSTRQGLRNVGTAARPRFAFSETAGVPATFEGETFAYYVQDTVEFVPNWKFMLGLRRDELDADYSSLTSPTLSFGETSVRTGVSWHPSFDTHYYLSYSDSFSPTADLYQLSGGAYPPERSKVTELGAKWLLLDGDLAFRSALYHAVKDWERNTDLESTAAILTRKRRTNGVEFELAGRITPNWDVFSGLALMDAEILKVAQNRNATTGAITNADPRLEGKRARNTPSYTFNLWSTYKLGGGWKLGGGVEAKGDRYAYVPSTTNASSLFVDGDFKPNTAPAYTRWDAMVAYEQKNWTARLNVKNLFDKVYYDSVYDNGGFTVPGTRRAVILTGEFKF